MSGGPTNPPGGGAHLFRLSAHPRMFSLLPWPRRYLGMEKMTTWKEAHHWACELSDACRTEVTVAWWVNGGGTEIVSSTPDATSTGGGE